MKRTFGLAGTAIALALSVAPAAHASTGVAVCNEAENSPRGGYVITDTPDPNPPAFLRGEQMRVGGDRATKGLLRAGLRSPALQVCSTTPAPSGPGTAPDPGPIFDPGPITGGGTV